MKFCCSKCGETHDTADQAWHFAEPLPWLMATEEEKAQSLLTPDQCELVSEGQMHYFIHALLQIPVREQADPFVWGVWCSQSEATNLEVAALWESDERMKTGPHFGWLCSRIPFYPDSMYLKTHVHQRAVGLRPLVELVATEHPLSIDQRIGIEPDRLRQIVEEIIHGS
jgi:hypothetical protein